MSVKQAIEAFIKEELILWTVRKPVGHTDWYTGENFIEGKHGRMLLKLLTEEPSIIRIYKNEARIRTIINRTFNRYLINLYVSEKEGYSQYIVNLLSNKLLVFLKNPNFVQTLLTPLLNVEVTNTLKFGEFEIVPINKNGSLIDQEINLYKILGLKITKLKQVEPTAQFFHSNFAGGNALRIKITLTKPEDFYERIMANLQDSETLTKKIQTFVTILRLFKDADIREGNLIWSNDSALIPYPVGSNGGAVSNNGYQYPLVDKHEIRKLHIFFNKFFNPLLNASSFPDQLQLGIEYFNSSYTKTSTHEKFIDLMIALDALFGVTEESTYRLKLRIACFLSKNKTKRKEVYEALKNPIKLRSNILHGKISPRDNKYIPEIEQSKQYLQVLARTAIVRMIGLYLEGRLNKNSINTFEEDFVI